MGWRIVYIEEGMHLSVYLENLKVKRTGKEDILIPLNDIHSIIIDNFKLVITVQLLNRCAKYNINVVTCGIDHLPEAITIPHSGHFASAKVFRKQLEWQHDQKALVHQAIVKQKIKNQIQACDMCGVDKTLLNFHKLNSYVEQVVIGDKTNREGLAAKIYFSLLFGKGFYRFDDDILNAGLNYGYAILRSQISKTLIAKGLHTSLGLFHKGPENAFNLSDDIIEVFRPIIDVWVKRNLSNETELSQAHRKAMIKVTTGKVLIDGKRQTIFNAIAIYIDSIINYMECEKPILFPTIDVYHEL